MIPSGAWLDQELIELFGIEEKLTGANAQSAYDMIEAKLATPEYRPRALFERFNIEVLATTDATSDGLPAGAMKGSPEQMCCPHIKCRVYSLSFRTWPRHADVRLGRPVPWVRRPASAQCISASHTPSPWR